MPEALVFTRQGRSSRTMAMLIVIYTGLLGAIILIDAAWWLMAALALLTLPALWDLWRDNGAGMRLGDARLDWHSGRRTGSLDLREIDHMRFDTRWDMAVRVTAELIGGKRVRLPYEALPPHRTLEAGFESRGIKVVRHHFTVF